MTISLVMCCYLLVLLHILDLLSSLIERYFYSVQIFFHNEITQTKPLQHHELYFPSADSRRAVVSFWRKNVHNTG